MIVFWTNTAEEHLDSIHAYIAKDSPQFAKRMVDRLTRRSIQIAEFPLSGRSVPEYEMEQIREVIEGPFRIIYYIKPDQIDAGRHPRRAGPVQRVSNRKWARIFQALEEFLSQRREAVKKVPNLGNSGRASLSERAADPARRLTEDSSPYHFPTLGKTH